MRKVVLGALAVNLAIAGTVLAAAPAVAEEPIPLTDIGRLAWLAGSWQATVAGRSSEEHWLPPAGGMMLGMARTVGSGGRASFEYLRIAKGGDGLLYYLASPGGKGETGFRLLEVGEKRAVFSNETHDWPKRITYWIAGDGALHARVEGGPGDRVEEYRWDRAGS